MVVKKVYGHPLFYKILDEMAELHSAKNKDYATPEHPLQNFDNVAKWCREYGLVTEGFESVKVCVIYAMKQFDAFLKLLKNNEVGDVEGIPQRLTDVAVYMILARILYEEDIKSREMNK